MDTPSDPIDHDRLIFRGKAGTFLARRGAPPLWREYGKPQFRGATHVVGDDERLAIEAAFYLRRPLLVKGDPGIGKSSLAHAIAQELGLGPVLVWPITSRTILQHGLYSYDAVGRFQESSAGGKGRADIGKYLSLGPLGTALVDSEEDKPRVLLIDELDKSDVDLPNDLLHVLEEGYFTIPELARDSREIVPVTLCGDDPQEPARQVERAAGTKAAKGSTPARRTVKIPRGKVAARYAPFILMTSNGEREFPPAFLRRCLRLTVRRPEPEQLKAIVRQKLKAESLSPANLQKLVEVFVAEQNSNQLLATDQLLNAAFLVAGGFISTDREELRKLLFQALQ